MVDPLEDQVNFYVEEAEKLGMNIVYAIDTHLHADHVSGARKLAEKTGAKDLYQSLQKITQLEDHIEVYPGAFSGSVCGRGLSGKPSSTIGFEKRHNEAMKFDNEKEFVEFMTSNVPPQPEGFKEMRKTNQGK
ncbi:MBL fold metallo-hydrolase [Bacillus aerolatus]|uniref:MBL fold metallo-hydrolase n=1 Tax=Bacillus aerolatus TaxID=2653354 RepID=UPI0021F085BF|nr:MBL fold metallo-hydrolase [Bacillus aerolatus]